MTDDGLRAVVEPREAYTGLPVLMLSQHVAPAHAVSLLESQATCGVGYLPKDQVGRVANFLGSVELVAAAAW